MIPNLNLKEQYKSIKEELDKAVLEVLESGQFVLGRNVKYAEEKIAAYCQARYGIGVASGTDALELALKACDIRAGDEVITTPFTFFASAETISKIGAMPVFVDVEQDTFNLDPKKIKEKITARTKAILPVHIFGHPVDLDPILDIAKKYNLKVIEDCAQAIGAEYNGKRVGAIGDVGTLSFYPTKNLGGAGDGGMIITNNHKITEKVKLLRDHGSTIKYYHSMLGYNSRLDEIQAAILLVKLKYLDEWTEKRRWVASEYNRLLKGTPFLVLPEEKEYAKHVYHQYTLLFEKEPLTVQKHLLKDGINTAIYYPLPLHLQEVYKHLGYHKGDLPNSEYICEHVLSLPIYPELTQGDIEEVARAVKKVMSAA